jgi:hypothetical protein
LETSEVSDSGIIITLFGAFGGGLQACDPRKLPAPHTTGTFQQQGEDMSTQHDLKEIERKAFRTTYRYGLWDMYMGLVVVCMAFFIFRLSTFDF